MLSMTVNSSAVSRMLDVEVARVAAIPNRLDAAAEVVYEATRQWFDSQGDGTWPDLAESTIARKESQGYSDPTRPLFASGNLYESATSPNGPYSVVVKEHAAIHLMIEWDADGWQIPVVLSEGVEGRGLPARPIWPPITPELSKAVGDVLMGNASLQAVA